MRAIRIGSGQILVGLGHLPILSISRSIRVNTHTTLGDNMVEHMCQLKDSFMIFPFSYKHPYIDSFHKISIYKYT